MKKKKISKKEYEKIMEEIARDIKKYFGNEIYDNNFDCSQIIGWLGWFSNSDKAMKIGGGMTRERLIEAFKRAFEGDLSLIINYIRTNDALGNWVYDEDPLEIEKVEVESKVEGNESEKMEREEKIWIGSTLIEKTEHERLIKELSDLCEKIADIYTNSYDPAYDLKKELSEVAHRYWFDELMVFKEWFIKALDDVSGYEKIKELIKDNLHAINFYSEEQYRNIKVKDKAKESMKDYDVSMIKDLIEDKRTKLEKIEEYEIEVEVEEESDNSELRPSEIEKIFFDPGILGSKEKNIDDEYELEIAIEKEEKGKENGRSEDQSEDQSEELPEIQQVISDTNFLIINMEEKKKEKKGREK